MPGSLVGDVIVDPGGLVARTTDLLKRFVALEASGGIVLLLATVGALVWAGSALPGHESLVHLHIADRLGPFAAPGDLEHWVNDGLMAIFFLVVGAEIKHEWVAGELRDRRAAALPAVAAIGGMVVPALAYVALDLGGSGARGWGIPMATDIAFALGVVALLGPRVPRPLKLFLLTLAIVDDVGAIVVIAVFYAESIRVGWLLAAAVVLLVAVAVLRAPGRRGLAGFAVLSVALWLCLFQSGVHATIAGALMGLLAPATGVAGREPLTDRLQRLLHPVTTFVVVPLFALVNAGIPLTAPSGGTGTRVLLGIVVGLVVGKPVGIVAGSWVAVRLGVGALPPGVGWGQVLGVAALGGIGFTVSLFVAGLAFGAGPVQQDAKLGILVASVVSAAVGSVVLVATHRRHRPT